MTQRSRKGASKRAPLAGRPATPPATDDTPDLARAQVKPFHAAPWVVLIVLGFAARLALSAISWGSNDAIAFNNFAHLIYYKGLLTAYVWNRDFNHPPIPGLWSSATLKLSILLIPNSENENLDNLQTFCFIFRLPAILADAVSAWLLYQIWKQRGGPRRGLVAAAAYALALSPILVSAYHGNTDTVYAMLSLLAVYLRQRGRPFWSGMALGAAVNIKLIPVFLILPLLASFKDRRAVIRFLVALALWILPFVPLFIEVGPDFYRNALAYKPGMNRWGLMAPGTWNAYYPPVPERNPGLIAYREAGRYLILALIVAWTGWSWYFRRWSMYEIAATTYCIFLVFANGFGVQYTAVVAPLLMACSIRIGAWYNLLAGLFLAATYFLYWEGDFPIASHFVEFIPKQAAVIGIFAWLILAYFFVQMVRRSGPPRIDVDRVEPAPHMPQAV